MALVPELPTTTTQKVERHNPKQYQDVRKINGQAAISRLIPAPSTKKRKLIVPEKDYQSALSRIDAMDLSDIESGSFEQQRHEFARRTAKRSRNVEEAEDLKAKVYYHPRRECFVSL